MSFLKAISTLMGGGRQTKPPQPSRQPPAAVREPAAKAPDPEPPVKKPDPTRHIYLIDTENVSKHWLNFCVSRKDGEFVLFFTDNSPKLCLRDLPKIAPILNRIQVHECVTGPNALDFQLVAYLGYQLGRGVSADTFYHIVSNDIGYNAAIMELSRLSKCRINRLKGTGSPLAEPAYPLPSKEPIPPEKLREARPLLPAAIPDKEKAKVLQILYENRSVPEKDRFTKVHNTMQTALTQSKATSYSQALKPRLREIYQILNGDAPPPPTSPQGEHPQDNA